MVNNQMTNYIMPTAEDVPPIHIFFEEIPFQHGGFGAKGIGELPHDGPHPQFLMRFEMQRAWAIMRFRLCPRTYLRISLRTRSTWRQFQHEHLPGDTLQRQR